MTRGRSIEHARCVLRDGVPIANSTPNAQTSSPGLEGQVVFVTGASQGLGRALALAFAATGAQIVAAARNSELLETLAAECGPRCLPLVLDVSDEQACGEAVRLCEATFGRLDVLVNNAGTVESRSFLDTDTALWQRTMRVNVEAPFWLVRAALPGMLDRGTGRVISIASIASKQGFAYVAPYTAAKHALLGLTRALATEYAQSGVTFNCVCPFYIDTPMAQATIRNIMEKTGRSEEEAIAPLLSPQGRLIETDEIASICLLLASSAGRSITGQGINVDGGRCQS